MTIVEKLQKITNIKNDISSALVESGYNVTNVFDTYSSQIRNLGQNLSVINVNYNNVLSSFHIDEFTYSNIGPQYSQQDASTTKFTYTITDNDSTNLTSIVFNNQCTQVQILYPSSGRLSKLQKLILSPTMTLVGGNSFKSTKISCVNLENVVEIGDYAFTSSGLQGTLNISSCTTIGSYAFGYTRISNILANSVTAIKQNAFITNTSIGNYIKNIYLPLIDLTAVQQNYGYWGLDNHHNCVISCSNDQTFIVP